MNEACARLVADNLHLLEQGRRLCRKLDGELFARPEPSLAASSIGAHLRHVIDHYASFLVGLAGGEVDYDARLRDPELEAQPERARERLAAIGRELAEIANPPALRVCMDSRGFGPERCWSVSSVERELQFLLSHTVHHYALIAVILRLAGRQTPREFGVAPSTLRHWREEKGSCAR